MSTSEFAFFPEEIEWLLKEVMADDALSAIGPEGRELGLCPYVTFYVYHQPEDYLAVADQFIAVWEQFQTLMDLPFKKVFKSRTQVWLGARDKRFPADQRAEARHHEKKFESFYLVGTDMGSPANSPRWSYSAVVDHVPQQCYSTVKLVFRYKWYVQNQARWQEFVRRCVASLQPEQCYMGFEVGNGGLGVMGAYEADVLERICADHFYGMDIDHPFQMKFQYHEDTDGYLNPTKLGAGLRPPTWCFMLSPLWQRKLGKSEDDIRAALADPRIRITAIPYATDAHNPLGANGLWIELGELDLYPINSGVPELLRKANALIRPIRCDELNLNSLDPWDDDPNPRFDDDSSQRWMGRFDDHSDWPSAAVDQPPGASPALAEPPPSPFLNPEEIEEFIRETKVHPQWFYGYEGAELGICPYVTFYVYHQPEDYLAVADKFIAVWEEFQTLMDLPFKKVFKSRTQVWLGARDKRFPADQRAEAAYLHGQFRSFFLMGTDMGSPDASPRWSYSAVVDHVPQHSYSTLKLVFRYKWYAQNQARWQEFVRRCVASLQPEQCYMGFEVGNGGLSVMGAYEADVLERICADHFYGMDIDHPFSMGYHDHKREGGYVNPTGLGAGLRPPTWCFMLSPLWQRKLDKSEGEIRAALADPRIRITAIPYATDAHNPLGANGLWIELGELDLYPINSGVPELLRKANALIRPIRCDELNLNSLEPWDDDPNPRFDDESSQRWIGRFDDDSDWPSAWVRRLGTMAGPSSNQRTKETN